MGNEGSTVGHVGHDVSDNDKKKDDANCCNSTLGDRQAVLIDLLRAVLCFAVPRSRKDHDAAGLP